MKLSKTPTEHIIINADCNSEWDLCNFAIATLKQDFIEKIKNAEIIVKELRAKDPDFYKISYWDYIKYFYNDENKVVRDFLKSDYSWSFIKIDEEELELLNTPEQKIEAQQLSIDFTNCFSWKGYGKHTGEDFFTADILIKDFLKHYTNGIL